MGKQQTIHVTTLSRRGLRFYLPTHIASGLAIMMTCAILLGSLSVGDSVKAGLRAQTRLRLGQIRLAISAAGLFRADLAKDWSGPRSVTTAPVLLCPGFADSSDGSHRAGVQVLGIDDTFWRLAENPGQERLSGDDIAVSRALARRLGLQVGDDMILHFTIPGGMSIESALTSHKQKQASLRSTVTKIIDDASLGGFDLYARPDGGMNVFMPLEALNRKCAVPIGQTRANLLVTNSPSGLTAALEQIKNTWHIEDMGMDIAEPNGLRMFELRHHSVFMPDAIVQALRTIPGAQKVFSYFINEFRAGDQTTPYSFVSAIEDPTDNGLFTTLAGDEMIINEWLADDLKVSEGEKIEIRYYVPAPGNTLTEQSASFRVKAVVPMMGTGADRSLMPSFESLADAENCRDWDPSIPVDLSRIRPEDEQYWKKYKGAPKAFIAMKTARLLWSSRFGSLTAIRFPLENHSAEVLSSQVLSAVQPSEIGFAVTDVFDAGQEAAVGTTDFGGLVIGMSAFLIIASLLLAGLVYTFSLQRRLTQLGILSAAGLSAGRIAEIFLAEEGLVAGLAILLGIPAAAGFNWLILWGLNTLWSDAAGGLTLAFVMGYKSIILGVAVSFFLSLTVFAWKLRVVLKRPVASLLDRKEEILIASGSGKKTWWISFGLLLFAAVAAAMGSRLSSQSAAGVFFVSAAILLAGLVLLLSSVLSRLAVASQTPSGSLGMLALRNAARRKGRSLAVTAALAIGVFLVFATAGFQKFPSQAQINQSTGGFALWAQSSVPMSLLSEADIGSMNLVPLRRYSQNDVSCLNLAAPSQPALWGVNPELLKNRFQFKAPKGTVHPADIWLQLDSSPGEDTVAAIGDWATVYWGLHKNLGDELDYIDQSGRLFKLRIVGLLDDSILQGGLMISEKNFLARFGLQQGIWAYLADVPADQAQEASQKLTRAGEACGLEVVPAVERLAMFHQVENTYIRIFLALGSLGLLVGSFGVGLIVHLNVMDRAGELAMMRAIGFGKAALIRMVIMEHAGLLLAGLIIGIVSAAVAAGPQLAQSGRFPWPVLATLAIAMLTGGFAWVWIAARAALSGELLDPLRKE